MQQMIWIAVAIAGVALAVRGGLRIARALREATAARGKNVRLMTGMRGAIVGSAAALAGAGGVFEQPGLIVLGLIIGVGELIETSVDAWALQRQLGINGGRSSSPPEQRPGA